MSNKDEKVINLAADENENNEANNTNELNELRESNESLIAEREALMKRVKELEEKLKETSTTKTRMLGYWQHEEKKVQLLVSIIKTGIKGTDYMTAAEFVEKIIEEI